jgi:hypothetical protein
MATVYIAPTAQGSADGTSEANAYAFSSLSSAETDAGSGGTILFLDGDYDTSNNSFQNGGSTLATLTYKSLNPLGARLIETSAYNFLLIGSTSASFATTTIIKDFYVQNLYYYPAQSAATYQLSGIKQVDTLNNNASVTSSGLLNGRDNSLAHTVNNCSFTFKVGTTSSFFHDAGAMNVNNTSIHLITDSTNANGIGQYTGTAPTLKNTIISVDASGKLNSAALDISKITYSCLYNTPETVSGNNIDDDPQFVDAPNGDLRLRPTSPCIGAGTAS